MKNNERRSGQTIFIAISFLIAFGLSFSLLVRQIDSQAFVRGIQWDKQPSLDIWFESDPPLVYESLTNTVTFWQKTNRHPLFVYLGIVPVKIMGLLGVPERMAVCLVLALGVGLSSAFFALTLLLILGLQPLTWLLQALFFSSSSFIFWAGICERFPLGAATIMATTAGVAYYSQKERMPTAAAVFLNVLSLSVTITNWMFGLLLSLCFFKPGKALRITAYTLLIAGSLWLLEGLFIRQFDDLIQVDEWNQKFLLNPYSGSVLQKVLVLVSHTVVIPEMHPYNFSGVEGMNTKGLLGVQHSLPGGSGGLEFGLAIGWASLLILGALTWWMKTVKTPFDRFLSLAIVGQVVLHLIYGTELFLYGPHVAPLLLLVVARGLGDLKRPALRRVLVGLSVFIPLLALHNIARYTEARVLYMERYKAGQSHLDRAHSADGLEQFRFVRFRRPSSRIHPHSEAGQFPAARANEA